MCVIFIHRESQNNSCKINKEDGFDKFFLYIETDF